MAKTGPGPAPNRQGTGETQCTLAMITKHFERGEGDGGDSPVAADVTKPMDQSDPASDGNKVLDYRLISTYIVAMAHELDLQARLLVDRSCFGLNIHRAGRAVAKKFDEAFRSAGINHWQFALLMTVNVPGGLSVSELARSLVVDRTTITANLKPLEKLNLLTIRVDEDDARARRIEISQRGKETLEQTYPLWQRINGEIAATVLAEKDDILGALATITTANS